MIYGYIRVSTKDQSLDRQIVKMHELGIPDSNIFMDKASGKSMDRDDWQRLMNTIAKGDEIVIDALDRLGRDYDGLVEGWKHITRVIGCDVKALDLDFFDSANFRKMGDLGRMVEDMLLSVLAYKADSERKKIVERTIEGLNVARKKGRLNGKPPKKFDPELIKQAQIALSSEGKAAAGRVLGVTRQTVYHMIEDGRLAI